MLNKFKILFLFAVFNSIQILPINLKFVSNTDRKVKIQTFIKNCICRWRKVSETWNMPKGSPFTEKYEKVNCAVIRFFIDDQFIVDYKVDENSFFSIESDKILLNNTFDLEYGVPLPDENGINYSQEPFKVICQLNHSN